MNLKFVFHVEDPETKEVVVEKSQIMIEVDADATRQQIDTAMNACLIMARKFAAMRLAAHLGKAQA